MIKPIIMPKLGETMEEGKISAWRKKEGDRIQKGEIIFDVVTDKANFEVESPYDGILLKIVIPAGDTNIPVTKVIGYIGDSPDEKIPENITETHNIVSEQVVSVEDTKTTKEQVTVSSVSTDKIKISPLAKKLAIELGIDITKVKGTGPGGRITEKDIQEYKEKLNETVAGKGFNEIILTGIRKVVADRLSNSKKEIPHFYLNTEVIMDECIKFKNKLAEKYPDIKITFTDIIVKSVSYSLTTYKDLNAHFVDNKIRIFDEINVGIAVAIDNDLVVPVIKNADKKSIDVIAKERTELVTKARNRKLTIDDMANGTITISNLGMYDIDNFNAIINPPQVAILAIGKIKEAPVVVDGKIVIGNKMNITISVDHRAVNGTLASNFLSRIKQILEKPEEINR